MSDWVHMHQPCPCGKSSDAYSINAEGWGKCFSCGKNFNEGKEVSVTQSVKKSARPILPFGEYRPLVKRKITEETCKKFGYFCTEYADKPVQVAPYHDKDGVVVAQKVRFPDKDFTVRGDLSEATLFGQKLWKPGGKRVVITEGEIDALSVSQAQGNKWPVVSIPNGAQGAVAAIKKNLEWVASFEEVVLMFDMDEPGEEAAIRVAELLPPGKAKIAHLPEKDANDMLVNNRVDELVSAIWQAKPFRPDGLVNIEDLTAEIDKPVEWGLPWFLPTLTKLTYGRRLGEIYAVGAGTGIGKTDFITQQIAYDVTELGEKVGVVFLEQKPVETAKRIAGKIAGKKFHVPDADWEMDDLKATVSGLADRITFYDSFGETDWDVVKGKLRFMAVSLGLKILYVDHLTAMADTSNEKESIEQLMKEMAGLAMELQVIIIFVSHLATPDGKPHEEGGRVMIRHFKGSRSIGFWSYFMFGLERDGQSDDESERHITTFRVLKDRYTGQATGNTIRLAYEHDTGRIIEAPDSANAHGFTDESSTGDDF